MRLLLWRVVPEALSSCRRSSGRRAVCIDWMVVVQTRWQSDASWMWSRISAQQDSRSARRALFSAPSVKTPTVSHLSGVSLQPPLKSAFFLLLRGIGLHTDRKACWFTATGRGAAEIIIIIIIILIIIVSVMWMQRTDLQQRRRMVWWFQLQSGCDRAENCQHDAGECETLHEHAHCVCTIHSSIHRSSVSFPVEVAPCTSSNLDDLHCAIATESLNMSKSLNLTR